MAIEDTPRWIDWEDDEAGGTPITAEALEAILREAGSYTDSRVNVSIGSQEIADDESLGALVRMVQVYDINGAALGYMPLYDGNAGAGTGGEPVDFPSSDVTLDAFNRSNGTVSSGGGTGSGGQANWANPIWTTQGELDVISNQLGNGAGTLWEDAFWQTTYGPGMEIYCTAKGGLGSLTMWACLWATGAPSGYALECAPDGGTEYILTRYDAGAPTVIGAAIPNSGFTENDSVGMRVSSSGGSIEIYHKPSAGAWTLVATRVDTNPSPLSQGMLGFEIQGTRRIDDFGGGGVVIGSGGGGGGTPPPGTLLWESNFNTPFPDGWSWGYWADSVNYPTATIESSWNGATNVAKFEVTSANLAASPPKKHGKVYKGFVFPGGSFDPGTAGELALIEGVYRARFWLPSTYTVPAGQVGSNIFQFKEKFADGYQNPHTYCYTWNAADVGLNPALGPALYVNNGSVQWNTARRTQLPLAQWFEIKVVIVRADSLKWYLNDVLFATIPASEQTIGATTRSGYALQEWIWGVGNYVETIPNAVYVDRAWKMTT